MDWWGMRPRALVLVGVMLGGAGCGVGAPAPSEEPAHRRSVPGPADEQAEHPAEELHEHERPFPAPSWDGESRRSARTTGTRAMRLFARPWVSEQTWFQELRSLLTAAGITAFIGTDPAAVPASKIVGPAVLEPVASAYLATVQVPTDAGLYVVLLVRSGAGEPWLVESIRRLGEREQ